MIRRWSGEDLIKHDLILHLLPKPPLCQALYVWVYGFFLKHLDVYL